MQEDSPLRASAELLYPGDDLAGQSALCLDWVNTLSWRGKKAPSEALTGVDEWLAWLAEQRALDAEALSRLRRMGTSDPDEAAAGLARAVAFREALYRTLAASVRGEAAPACDKLEFAGVLNRAMMRLQLVRAESGWSLRLAREPVDWEAPLYPVALSAAQLLAGPHASLLRVCQRPECRWLFLDGTKNRSKKWCAMEPCGNVVKARRSYARRKARTGQG